MFMWRQAVQDPQEEPGNPEESRRAVETGKGQRRKRHRSSRTRLILLLILILLAETGLLVALYVRLGLVEKEKNELQATERKQMEELENLRPQVEQLRDDVQALTQGRLPDLQKIELDAVIPIEKGYVRNIVFSVSGKGDQQQYEYKLVMQNNGLNLMHPAVDILFFDRSGIQVGGARIGAARDGSKSRDLMELGETRSFSSTIEMLDRAKPEYFRLRFPE